jgi:acetyl esterase/lipase
MSRRHVVITGTGRAGTTFLVQLLTYLGLDTGFTPQDVDKHVRTTSRAGLEHDIRDDSAPYIVKSPWFCDHGAQVLKRDDILIEHVFIPMRNLRAAAESRRYVQETTASEVSPISRLVSRLKPSWVHGGLWHTSRQGEQEDVLLRQLYRLALALSESSVPVTFMHYPTVVKDSAYLYAKLAPVLGDITPDQFDVAFQRVVRPEWVHSFDPRDVAQ